MSDALEGLRVVEFASPLTAYCGKLFAGLGAEVVLVEPPGGAALRQAEPLLDAGTGETANATFLYTSVGKRSVEIGPDDVDFLDALLGTAAVVLEAEPGGLDEARLAALAPHAVVTSISPFGRTGPYAGYAANDLVCLALGGLLSLTGYGDGPPVQLCAEQAYVMGGMYAAAATMIAVHHAEIAGEGQQVDVSLQECVSTALENAAQFYDLEGVVRTRPKSLQRHAGTGVYPCADGLVYLYVGGVASNRFWSRLVEWLAAEGIDGAEELNDPQWSDRAFLDTEQALGRFAGIFGSFAEGRTKRELYEGCQTRGIPLCPVNTAADVVADVQLRAREFFVPFGAGEWPGAPYRLSATPWRLGDAVPELGAGGERLRREVLHEVGT